MLEGNVLVVVTSVLIPLIVITWLCCLGYCLLKNLATKLETQRQSTAVTVVVASSTSSAPCPTPLFTPSRPPSTRVATTYAPVTSHLASSLTLSDFMRGGELGLNDSLGPRYYPKQPLSEAGKLEELPPLDQLFPSPMAPLQPPWPHLPPIEGVTSQPSQLSTRVTQLSSQILNPTNLEQRQNRR